MIGHTTSAAWMAGVVDALASQKLDVAGMFAELGISFAALADIDARFPTEKVSALWRLAAERSRNPAIGLAAGTTQAAGFEVLGYAMMSSPNLLAGLDTLARYLRLVTEAGLVRIEHETDSSWVRFELYGGGVPVPPQRYQFDFLCFLRFCRWFSGRSIRPLEVQLAEPSPDNVQPYADAFECPLHFGATEYRMRFSRADLVRPLPTANEQLAELHSRILGERMERHGDSQVSQRVREEITKGLPRGEPRREDIARALHLSERTLQRRLHDEGTSFQELLEDTRRDLARRYLRQRQLPLAEAAYLLGFAEQSTFQRACRRWFATSPHKYRKQATAQPALA